MTPRPGSLALVALALCASCGGDANGGRASLTTDDDRRARWVAEQCTAPAPTPTAGTHVRFESIAVAPGPVGLARAVAVWTGREHLVFGGAAPQTPSRPGTVDDRVVWAESPAGTAWTSPGYALDPSEGTWRALPGAFLPGTTGGESVAWHCGRAFVLTPSGVGYRYDPITGEATPTSTAGAPTGCRGQHVSVDGSRAMIFGCDDCRGHVYDAADDAWSEMGEAGDEIAWAMGRCATMPTHFADGSFFVLRQYRDAAGGRWSVRTRTWESIPETGSPEQVLAGPVGQGGVLWLVGTTGSVAGLYHYEVAARAWSVAPLANGVCSLGTNAALVGGDFLVQAGAWSAGAPACAYDLERGAEAGALDPIWSTPSAITSMGDDHVFFWGGPRGTDEGDGEMPRTPTRWLDNSGRLVRFHVEP